ncbi:MAG: type II 3-dehydroquinate dehydratase [Gemmatimonadetes bacterium]|nr:type II 3-dehydroquinate dehydratase [Gemmatimonadota bacterium]
MKILVLSGPNLNLLGTREPHLYGTTTLADIERDLVAVGAELGVSVECRQSNHEGVLIDLIHGAKGSADGIVINAGAYSHTSLAIRDALSAVAVPYAEVHLTNIFAREPERRHTTLAAGARAILCGFGAPGYALALRGLVAALRA